MTSDPSTPRSETRRRRGFAVVVASITAMMAGASAPSPFYPALQEQLGLLPVATTTVFAVYAFTLLAALLVFGSISDHVGRRPVMSAGFALLAVSVLLFLSADSLGMLVLARILQGVASGVLLSALSATIADLEHPDRPGGSAVWNTVSPLAGLAVGALVSALLLDLLPDPRTAVFLTLAVAYVVLAALIWAAPETSGRDPGWARSLRPRLAVPVSARRAFVIGAPAVFAGWATGGIYLSLGPSIVHGIFGIEAHLWQGLVITALAGVGSMAGAALHGFSARTIAVFGTSALAVGTSVSLIGVALASFPVFLVGVVISGAGFGTAFMGVMRSVTPLVQVHDRAGTFASIFVVAYLAFGVPAIVAGLVAPLISLQTTTYVYAALVIVLAVWATVSRARAAGVA